MPPSSGKKFTEFEEQNPVNCGPNWASAQEAAMRILTWTMVYQVFKDSPATTVERKKTHVHCALQHAARIPPTLAYAVRRKTTTTFLKRSG